MIFKMAQEFQLEVGVRVWIDTLGFSSHGGKHGVIIGHREFNLPSGRTGSLPIVLTDDGCTTEECRRSLMLESEEIRQREIERTGEIHA